MDVLGLLPDGDLKLLAKGPPRRPSHQFELVFPASLIDAASQHLKQGGNKKCEELVLFGGVPVAHGVAITTLLMPKTEASWGHVTILRSEQPAIAAWLADHNHLLFLEAHTHGTDSTEISFPDKRHPVSVRNGFITAIIPFYAKDGISFMRAGIWECRALMWYALTADEVRNRFKISPDAEARTYFDRQH